MTEAKRPLKVFLCHAHADRDHVHALYERLTKDGMAAWLDKEKPCGELVEPSSQARIGNWKSAKPCAKRIGLNDNRAGEHTLPDYHQVIFILLLSVEDLLPPLSMLHECNY